MAPRPIISVGQYILTKPLPTQIRCKAYDGPPGGGGGSFITTISPGTHIGPVEEVVHTDQFVTILCRGYWINIWRAARGTTDHGTDFAFVISQRESDSWCWHGWSHQA